MNEPMPEWTYDELYEPDEDVDEMGNIRFECPAYWTPGDNIRKGFWHCPLAGTEECDWECKK